MMNPSFLLVAISTCALWLMFASRGVATFQPEDDAEGDSSSRFAVLMDAGSTGTRVHVFSWDSSHPFETLREVGSTKARIALSSLVNDDSGINSLLDTLISFADKHIPESHRADTTISLKATAGLRRLSDEDQLFLISAVRNHFEASRYFFMSADTAVIPGHEEALYDYLAIVVAMEDTAVGVLDLGGASKQLSYVLNSYSDSDNHAPEGGSQEAVEVEVGLTGESSLTYTAGECVPDYILQLPGSTSPTALVARSLQGMGLLAAMDHILALFVDEEAGRSGEIEVLPQPCLAVGETARGEIHDYDTPLQGYGNVTECYELIRLHFLDKVAEEIDLACLQKNKPSKFVAMDNFPKLLEMLGLVGKGLAPDLDGHSTEEEAIKAITPQIVLEAGQAICQLNWQELLDKFPADFPPFRAQRACFGAAYTYFFMTDVYGIHDLAPGEFLPLESHKDHDLGWVLGAVAVSTHPNREELVSYVSESQALDGDL